MSTAIVHRPEDVGCSVVIMCDVSGSMQGKRIERLTAELARIWPELKGAKLMAFADYAFWVDSPRLLPRPRGGTYLDDALILAGTVFPSQTIVISDGLPRNEEAAIKAAMALPGTIDVCFVGDDGDYTGADFMRRLARVGGGIMVHKDLARNVSIEGSIRGMLALPSPIAL